GAAEEDAGDGGRSDHDHRSALPSLRRDKFDPPALLFARGRVDLLQSMAFGVVGTRRPTPYGMAAAERLSGDLARAGLTIVSGLARGIDTARKRPPRQQKLPCWDVARCGPVENRNLEGQLPSKGLNNCRISDGFDRVSDEFPHSQPDHPRNERGMARGRGRPV